MSDQTSLRDEIIALVLERAKQRGIGGVQASVACFGALAAVVAALPPDTRRRMVTDLADSLPSHVEHRASQQVESVP